MKALSGKGPLLASLVCHHRAGYRYWKRYGIYMRCVVVSYGDGTDIESFVMHIHLSPPHAFLGRRAKLRREPFPWWENGEVELKLSEAVLVAAPDLSKSSMLIVIGNSVRMHRHRQRH